MWSSSMQQQNDEIKETLLWHTERPVRARTRNRDMSVNGLLMNCTKHNRGQLQLLYEYPDNSRNMNGNVTKYVIKPPTSLGATSANFLLRSKNDDCKGAVIYGSQGHHNTLCAWLLAWHHSRHGDNKVYAECGEKGNMESKDWTYIEDKLDRNGSSTHLNYTDPDTGAKLMATIGQGTVAAAFMD